MSRRRRRRRLNVIVPVASMGDIAFLLIIFFVLCGNMTSDAGKKIEPPRDANLENQQVPSLSVSVAPDGEIRLQGHLMSSPDVLEARLRDAIAGKTDKQSRLVEFRCDKTVGRAVFLPVMKAISKAGASILAVGEKETRAGG